MKNNCIPIISRKISAKISLEDILTLKNDARKLNITTEDAQYHMCHGLKNIEDMLDERFVACKKGFYVNLDKIMNMQKDGHMVNLTGGSSFGLGRDSYIRLNQKFNAYLRDLIPSSKTKKDVGSQSDKEKKAEGNKKFQDH